MRHLVYRVQPLPQSLLPLVWDFGTLKTLDIKVENNIHKSGGGESDYIKQMLIKAVRCFTLLLRHELYALPLSRVLFLHVCSFVVLLRLDYIPKLKV